VGPSTRSCTTLGNTRAATASTGVVGADAVSIDGSGSPSTPIEPPRPLPASECPTTPPISPDSRIATSASAICEPRRGDRVPLRGSG
jgi:hypothetical protein